MLNTVLNMVLNMVLNIVLNKISNMASSIVSNKVSNMVLNAVLNMFLSRNTNLVSTKQFISFSFYITSFSRLILDFSLTASFIRVNVSNSNKISDYSSSEMESSDNAFEMTLLIVLRDETDLLTSQSFHFFYFQRKFFNCLISYNSK